MSSLNLRRRLVRLDSVLGPLEGVHSKLLDICLSSYIIMNFILRSVISLELLQLVHQVRRVGHAFVRLGVETLVEDGIDDQVFA
jgi:hypothetical protein